MRVRTSLFQRGMEAYEKVKSHTANKQDLALVLRLLSDREAIRRGLGKTAGGDFESRYLCEEIIDELVDFLWKNPQPESKPTNNPIHTKEILASITLYNP